MIFSQLTMNNIVRILFQS